MQVLHSLPNEHRGTAARMYYDAFARKLSPILRDDERAIAMFERELDSERAIVAVDGDRLLGIAGVQHDGRQLAAVPLRAIVRTFGPVRGTLKALVLGVLFERTPRHDELVMDGIAVAPDTRGSGVGTSLLEAVFGYARARGFRSIRLDVVDTNPRARALYERMGFVAERTESTPYLRRWLGFGAATTMIKTL